MSVKKSKILIDDLHIFAHLLKLSFCDLPKSVVRHHHLPFGHSRCHIFCSIDLKFSHNVSLDQISDKFEFGSPGIKKLGHYVKLKKYLVGALETTFLAQLT